MTKTDLELVLTCMWGVWLLYAISCSVTGMIYTRSRNYNAQVKPKKFAICVLFGVVWLCSNILCSLWFWIWSL